MRTYTLCLLRIKAYPKYRAAIVPNKFFKHLISIFCFWIWSSRASREMCFSPGKKQCLGTFDISTSIFKINMQILAFQNILCFTCIEPPTSRLIISCLLQLACPKHYLYSAYLSIIFISVSSPTSTFLISLDFLIGFVSISMETDIDHFHHFKFLQVTLRNVEIGIFLLK